MMSDQVRVLTDDGSDELQICEANPRVILKSPLARQEVFGKLIWRPERVQELLVDQRPCPLTSRTGNALLVITSIAIGMAGCASDYVYIQNSRSESEVRQDYTVCAEQQFKVSNDTTECMKRKGYRTVKIDATTPAADHVQPSPTPLAFLP
jgi:hypothetical protein